MDEFTDNRYQCNSKQNGVSVGVLPRTAFSSQQGPVKRVGKGRHQSAMTDQTY